jgi:glycine/D-amino acid oxidase-like deaminating enzyme
MTKSDEGKTVSYWEASENLLEKSALGESIETDVCIIGGGISGFDDRLSFDESGKRVIVVDDGAIGGGETARTTAHLSDAIDDRIYRIEDWHGAEKRSSPSKATARRSADRTNREAENIDCDFLRVDGFLIEAEDGGEDDLEKELETARISVSVKSNERRARQSKISTRANVCVFRDRDNFTFSNIFPGLAKAVEQNGGRLYFRHQSR